MPGACDRAVFDVTSAERGAHVRARVVYGEELSLVSKDSDRFIADLHRSAFAFVKVIDFAHPVVFRHDILDHRT